MDKSPEAFRTISEVAEVLETPAHVLRFWESRFPQIRPVKRAGGRRYYRPSDVALLTGIKRLLHDEGMTIRGVQKILREQGVRHVSGLTDEAGAEEDALDRAMVGRLDEEIEVSPDEANEAAAEALREALSAPPARGAAIYSFPAEPRAAPAGGDGDALPDGSPGDAGPDDPAKAVRPLPPDAAPPPAASVPPAAESPAAEEAPVPAGVGDDAEIRTASPIAAPRRPRAATAEPAREMPDEDPLLATPAARLRALPRGSLAPRRDALVDLRGRIAELRARLARPPGGL